MGQARLTPAEKRIRKNEYERQYNEKNRDKVLAQRRARYAQRKLDDPEKLAAEKRAQKLKHRYGLSQEEYNARLASQNNACALCGQREDVLHVDHCHTSGAVRGLLCHHCNVGLGHFKDNTMLLTKAIQYLKCSEARA
jgi:hypothetical protein